MASAEDNVPADGGRPDPSPRREPRTIDVEAVEVPIAGAASHRQHPDASETTSDAANAAKSRVASPWRSRLAAVGLFAVATAGAAALGFYFAPGGDSGVDELRTRVASLEAQRRDDAARPAAANTERAKLDDLTARLVTLEAVAATPAAAPPVAPDNRLPTIEAALKSLAGRLDEIDRQIRDNATAARLVGERADTVAAELGELKKTDETSQPAERAALDSLTARVMALEGLEATLKSAGQRADSSAAASAAAATMAAEKPLRAAITAAALRNAVEHDYPFTIELAAARPLDLDAKALAALEPFAATGVPNANALFRELSGLMPELARLSASTSRDGNYLERLRAGADRLVRIRPVGDVAGDDPATVIGRIEFKMTRQDVAGVVADLDKLPVPAQALVQSWRKKALERAAAIDAARHLASAAFVQLGEAPDLAPQ